MKTADNLSLEEIVAMCEKCGGYYEISPYNVFGDKESFLQICKWFGLDGGYDFGITAAKELSQKIKHGVEDGTLDDTVFNKMKGEYSEEKWQEQQQESKQDIKDARGDSHKMHNYDEMIEITEEQFAKEKAAREERKKRDYEKAMDDMFK